MKASGFVGLTVLVLMVCPFTVDPGGGLSPTGFSGPDLVLSARVHDFGTLIPGQRTAGTVSLRNTGSEPLEIRLVRTSSRRLAARLSQSRLPPGGEEALRIEFRSNVWERGPFIEHVVFYSNDLDEPLAKVRVKGVFVSPVGWSPKFVQMRVHRGEITALTEIQIVPLDDHPIGPLRVISSVPHVFAEAEAEPGASGAYTVTLRLDPLAPLEQVFGRLRIETNHPLLPVVEVPVRLQIVGDLVPQPYRLDFGIVEEGRPADGQITLVNLGGLKVKVVKVEPHLPTAAKAKVSKKGQHYQIKVHLPSPPGLQRLEGHLKVHTDHPLESVFEVPVVGWVWAISPFDLVAAEGTDARLYGLVRAALYREEAVSPGDFFTKILGGVRDDRAVSLVLRALGDCNWHIRTRAVEMLGHLGNCQALELVKKAVTDDVDEEVRRAAAAALVSIAGREALPELVLALQDDDAWVREDAAHLLGNLGDRRAVPALKNALGDEDEDVREAVTQALKKMDTRMDQ